MRLPTIITMLLTISLGCQSPGQRANHHNTPSSPATVNPFTRIGDIALPAGYARQSADTGSFAAWLRRIPLKKDKTVYLFNGQPKANQEAQYAVMDVPVGSRDLQQCADALMRLRAEYLFAQQRFADILFIDNEGGQYPFTAPYTRPRFEAYLQRVFGMCGSASLAKQLRPAAWGQLQPGNVLIRGGFPGHAVMVMDVAQNTEGNKIYLLAQSYMPAQDIHVLRNPTVDESPWYEVTGNTSIVTPEWVFKSGELRGW
jgi:hypothetical protein